MRREWGRTPNSYLSISFRVLCFDSKAISSSTATEEAYKTGEKRKYIIIFIVLKTDFAGRVRRGAKQCLSHHFRKAIPVQPKLC